MNKIISISALILALSSMSALADTNNKTTSDLKNYTVSVGSYARTFTYDIGEQSFVGYSISGMGKFAETERFEFAGHIAASFLENEITSALESNSYEANLLLGQNLTQLGFKWYAGAGIFTDKFELNNASLDFSGVQFAGGVGYNTEKVSFDLFLNARPPSAYEELSTLNSVVSAMFSIGLRF